MRPALFLSRAAVSCAAGLCLIGCGLLSPSGITPRAFVLTPISSLPAAPSAGSTNIVIGIRTVKVPGYLATKDFAMRRGTNEIVYLESVEWAERLDSALQRVLAANLGALIPTDQVRLSLWQAGAASVQVEVSVEQFDVDSRGQGVFIAWWRLLSAGDEVMASGRFSATRQAKSPDASPGEAVSAMSSLAADLARKLAQVIKESRGSQA